LPFVFEASGTETHFTNGFDPDPRARRLFHFPQPSTLADILKRKDEEHPTWCGKVHALPPLDERPLRPAQIKAINGVETSLAEQRYDRSLVQMATGAGKTYTAVTLSYRLLKHGGFNRILFLVDRNNLAKQTMAEFENYQTPDDGRKFSELYNVNRLRRGSMPDATSVVISTIQRVVKALRNEEVGDTDDPELDGWVPEAPVTVAYNPDIPPETFDLIIVDEAHRSIYGQWQGVLEYFDAHVVGLTATPGMQTFGFFKPNLVSEYTYPQSVADNVNVDFDIYRIKTEISRQGSTIDAGTVVPKVERRTRAQRYEALDEDLEYKARQLDRAVTATDQIRIVLETFRDRLFTEIFPGRSVMPKTLVFAKDDAHAEEIVTQVREVFGKGNDFAAKITYNARNAEQQLAAFRTSAALRVAVTVDMIATGTDVKPLECVFFMRDVHSPQYFEQMKGHGARTIPHADFQAVTPDAKEKTRFVLVDAIGVTEHDFVEPPLNRVRSISLAKLLEKVANLTITEDETATLASRLAALEAQITSYEREEWIASRTARYAAWCDTSSTRSTRMCRPRLCSEPTTRTRRASSSSSTPSGRWRRTPICGRESSSCAAPTAASSTRPPPTRCSMPTASSTRARRSRSSSRGAPTSTSTAPRSPPSSCSAKPANGVSRSTTSRSWPTASPGRPTTGRRTSSGMRTSPSRSTGSARLRRSARSRTSFG